MTATPNIVTSLQTSPDQSVLFPDGLTTSTKDIYQWAQVVSTQVDVVTSTTLTATGLSVPVRTGAKYVVRGHITGTADVAGGIKVALGSTTATVSQLTLTGMNYNGTTLNANSTTTSTTLGTTVGGSTAVFTDLLIYGSFTVTASADGLAHPAGNMFLEFTQNASHSGNTSVLVGSYWDVIRVS